MPSQPRLKLEAERMLKLFRSTQFEDCLPLERGYNTADPTQ